MADSPLYPPAHLYKLRKIRSEGQEREDCRWPKRSTEKRQCVHPVPQRKGRSNEQPARELGYYSYSQEPSRDPVTEYESSVSLGNTTSMLHHIEFSWFTVWPQRIPTSRGDQVG